MKLSFSNRAPQFFTRGIYTQCVFTVFWIVFSAQPAQTAQAVTMDQGIWNAIFFQSKVSPESPFKVGMELQNRLTHYTAANNRTLLRPSVLYSINPSWSLAAGVGYLPEVSSNGNEVRLWQQVLWKELGGLQLQVRGRLEQRWVGVFGVSKLRAPNHRLRLQVRSVIEKIALSNEFFYHFNTSPGVSVSGVDQNRFFVGPAIPIAEGARFEIGYLNQYQRRPTVSTHLMTHLAVVNLFWDL